MLTRDGLDAAVNQVVAIMEEHRGSEGAVDETYARFGVDAGDLRGLLAERWECYRDDMDEEIQEVILEGADDGLRQMFVRAYAEGVLVGLQARR